MHADTLTEMIYGFIVIFGVLLVYVISLIFRACRCRRAKQTQVELETQAK